MLIPQARIGIGERRRPDFVVFIPLQQYRFRWIAVEIDGGHNSTSDESDQKRNAYLADHGYEIFSIRPSTPKGYFEEARRLVEHIDAEMKTADRDPSKVAVEARVFRTTPADDIPF
ncbi:hypothetical protein GTY96_28695 [Corallococcus sp. c25j21]|nr:hypothetical protein [Corallococcus silvisoli]